MSVTTIKAERVVQTALMLLEREVILPRLVWRDAVGDFAGAKDDTISIRVPSYTKARKNALRSGAARTRDNLVERKVDVSLTDRLYKDVRITDENLTLDLRDFSEQVMSPVLRSLVIGYEDEIATLITGATYENELELDTTDPYNTVIDARKLLNDASVPQTGRVLAVGSGVEARLLKSDQFARADQAGDASALREAQTGRVGGFDVVVSNALPPDEAYAFHRTAFVLSTRAPQVPAGAPWGASLSQGGFALRAVQVLDPDAIENILATEGWVGTDVVTDHGSIDADGKFVPSEDPDNPGAGEAARLVRAVKIAVVS